MGAIGAAALAARRKGPVLTAVSTGKITLLNVRDSEAVADRPGTIEVKARAVITNLGDYDKDEFWWSLQAGRDYGRDVVWRQDYRPRSFGVGRGDTEVTFSQDLDMPPGHYDMWLGIHKAGTYYDRDGTVMFTDPAVFSEVWRATVW
jgi:hypothetical protein